MKNLIATLMILTGAALGQDASCSTLYTNPNLTLCHVGDTYTQTFNNGSSVSESPITEETYLKWMADDAAALQAHTSQLAAVRSQQEQSAKDADAHMAAVNAAAKITSKKACLDAGFDWQHSMCSVKGDK